MAVAVITMVHKDHWFLEKWIGYYGKHFGLENLYVILHGADERAHQIAKGANIIPLPRSGPLRDFASKKSSLFNSLLRFLHDSYEAVITVDVDEILAIDPQLGDDLKGWILNKKQEFAVIAKETGQPAIKIMNAFFLELRPHKDKFQSFDDNRMVISQRPSAVLDLRFCKPIVSFAPVSYNRGQHNCEEKPNLTRGLFLFHLKFANETIFEEAFEYRNEVIQYNEKHNPTEQINMQWKIQKDRVFDEVAVAGRAYSFGRIYNKVFATAQSNYDKYLKKEGTWAFKRLPDRFYNLHVEIPEVFHNII